jgi:hypothetical protein
MDPVSERIVLDLVKRISFKNRKLQKACVQKACALDGMHSKCMLFINMWKAQGKLSSVGSA